MDRLEPFIGKRVRARCSRCGRVLDVLTVSTTTWRPAPGEGEVDRQPGGGGLTSWADSTPNGRGSYARPTLGVENANRRDDRGRRLDWDETNRVTYTCHRRCGSNGRRTRYTVTGTLLEERFVGAARSGLDSFDL